MKFESGSEKETIKQRMKNRKNCWGKYSCECDVLPAGTYYIGDPCYAIGTPDYYWSNLCKVMADEESHNETAKWNKDKKGKKDLENYGLMVSNPSKKDKKFYDIAIYGTAYGDGSYDDMIGTSTDTYWVDAGIIGAIPVEAIPKNKKTRVTRPHGRVWFIAGGHFVKFDEEVHCYTDGRFLHFGNSSKHIKIDTDPPGDETDDTY